MRVRHDAADGWVTRYDRGALLSVHERPDGSLLVSGNAARGGILEYRDAAGRVTRELVPESTLLAANETLGRAPLTLQHPDGDVTPSNVQDLGVGDVDGTIEMAGGYVQVRVAVRRKDAIDAVRSGQAAELSPGYRVRLDPTPGVDPVHGRYDAVQTERVVNHLALVTRARGGPTVRLRTDAAEATEPFRADGASTGAKPTRSKTMLSILLQGLALLGIANRYDSEEIAASALVDALRARKDAADADARKAADDLAAAVRERNDARTALQTMTTERDTQRARADAAETTLGRLQAEAKTRADAAEREGIVDLCTRYRVDGTQELPKVKRAIAEAFLGTELRADATDAYVDGILAAARKDRADGIEAGGHAWDPTEVPARRDGAGERRLSSRERYHAALGLDKATG